MNLLIFAHDSSLYGASQSLLTLIEGITKKKERKVLVILPNHGKMEEKLHDLHIDYKIVPFEWCAAFRKKNDSAIQKMIQHYTYIKKTFSILPQLYTIAIQFNADVIYTNTSVVSVGYLLSKKLKIPHIWHIREFGDLDFDLRYFPNRKKIVQFINNSTKVIYCSYAIKNHWIINESLNHTVIYNGIIDTYTNNPYSKKKIIKANINIGLIGSILPGKGQHIAIEAFAKIIQKISYCNLYFYGGVNNQDYFINLKNLVNKLNLGNKVFFEEFCDNRNTIYQNLDLVINCSKMEGFGRTIVEAMNYGIPVIANASGGVLEIIEDNKNGLLYDSSIENLTDVVIKVLSDKELYESLSYNGRHQAKKYSVTNYVNAIDSILIETCL